MKRILCICVALMATVFARPAAAESTTQVIVKSTGAHVASGTGAKVVDHVDSDTNVVSVPSSSVSQAVALMKSQPGVVYAEPDIEYHATSAPNDPCYTSACISSQSQWAIDKMSLPSAWNTTTGRSTIKIGIVDSGVDIGHPDLAGHVSLGPNYSSDTTTDDLFGHGTHVAGIAGALTNNGVGVAGTDPNAQMLSIKVLNANGVGTASNIAKGIRYAADAGDRIINLSLGASGYSQTLADAVSYAESLGALVVCAADNNSTNVPSYPAALPGVLSVGSSTQKRLVIELFQLRILG